MTSQYLSSNCHFFCGITRILWVGLTLRLKIQRDEGSLTNISNAMSESEEAIFDHEAFCDSL